MMKCPLCKKEHPRLYITNQQLIDIMNKLDINDQYHRELCSQCLNNEIQYMTSDSEEPYPETEN